MSKRVGRTVVDDGVTFEVMFPCAAPAVQTAKPLPCEPWVAIEDHRGCRVRLLSLLAEQEVWKVRDLRKEANVKPSIFFAAVQNLRRSGRTVHPERGVVRLVRAKVAA